jgi:hypothetical protein
MGGLLRYREIIINTANLWRGAMFSITASKYRETTSSLPEIARALGVVVLQKQFCRRNRTNAARPSSCCYAAAWNLQCGRPSLLASPPSAFRGAAPCRRC